MVRTRLKVGSYEAWVVVEGERVEHHEVEVDDEMNTATGWITSTTGKSFVVCVKKRHSRFNCRVNIWLDGSSADGGFLSIPYKKPIILENVLIGEDTVRPFMFGELNVTEDEAQSQLSEEIGIIKVVIHRITGYKCRDHIYSKTRALPERRKIHERAKKALTHQISFGRTQKIKEPKYPRTVSYTQGKPVATFIFKYQSLAMLQAREIILSDPPSVKIAKPGRNSRNRKAKAIEDEEEEEKPVVEIIDAKDEEYKRKEAQLEAELKKVRQERLEHQKAKCEPKPVFLPGEVVDLTGDA